MRRYELDWLRVIAFGLLIFYHVGMLFVPWGFHLKNNRIYDWLVYPMLFLNQWRLPLLFVISGMGTWFALQNRTGGQFAGERIKRLLLPLLFGMAVIVPPQIYAERLAKHQFSGSYLDFWPASLASEAYPMGNLSWHHLWFLPYLLLFSLVLIPAFLYVKKNRGNALSAFTSRQLAKSWGMYIFIIPLYLIEAFIEPFFPVTHALTGDWFTIINTCTLFFFGFLLISSGEIFWKVVRDHRRRNLVFAIVAFLLLMARKSFLHDSYLVHFTEAFVSVFNFWSWILVLFGYASVYLTRSSRFLAYANEAVFPFYILHQTVMMVIAYYLIDQSYGFVVKFVLLVAGTFAGSLLIYELLIRRWKLIRPLFGLKQKTTRSKIVAAGPEAIKKASLIILVVSLALPVIAADVRYKHILITNDDGIGDRERLIALAKAVKTSAERVSILVSDTDRSGFSNKSLMGQDQQNITVKKLSPDTLMNISVYTTNGYPADCVLLGLTGFFGNERPDLVLSGINGGANAGPEWFGSGTIGAARMAAFLGVRSVAFSGCDEDSPLFGRILNWIAELINSPLVATIGDKQFLTVGFPGKGTEIEGVKIAERRIACEWPEYIIAQRADDPENDPAEHVTTWKMGFSADPRNMKKMYDDALIEKNYIVITPMTIEENSSALLTKWRTQKFQPPAFR
ncbi:acyltransferase family protein [Terrimonas sp. NA20]|uniref:5'-nucleotidase n=1 Tax=Terrimonas ginsenosidimutans TaxID=2908004 RepID=A0ABS9KWL9_9BACT|nr:5'/3'-nucleotidase SurE [Terrimonas ginsenosidimutans]MCG2616721.1 acyltransferase family protein [Terrimonas ginsenosidimutans]